MVAVTKDYPSKRGPVRAVEGIDLHVEEGELVCLVGASGCGKSTLLSIAAGLQDPTDGAVLVDGLHVTGRRPTAGWCPRATPCTRGGRWPRTWPSAWRSRARPRPSGAERVGHLLEVMGLTAFAGVAPSPAVGRHAPAGGHRPGHGDGAVGAPVRRALRRPRLPDPGLDAGVRPPGEAGHPGHDPDGHPRRRGGGVPVEPGLRADVAARPDRHRAGYPVRRRPGPAAAA